MKTRVLVIVVALTSVFCATAVWTQGPPPGPGGPPPPGMASPMIAVMVPRADMLDGLTKVLGLTTDQAASLKTILASSDAAIPPLVQAAGEKSKALRTAVLAATLVDSDVATAVQEAKTAEAAVIDACITAWAQIRGVLTADQLATLQAVPPGPPHGPPPGPPPGGSSTFGGNRR